MYLHDPHIRETKMRFRYEGRTMVCHGARYEGVLAAACLSALNAGTLDWGLWLSALRLWTLWALCCPALRGPSLPASASAFRWQPVTCARHGPPRNTTASSRTGSSPARGSAPPQPRHAAMPPSHSMWAGIDHAFVARHRSQVMAVFSMSALHAWISSDAAASAGCTAIYCCCSDSFSAST